MTDGLSKRPAGYCYSLGTSFDPVSDGALLVAGVKIHIKIIVGNDFLIHSIHFDARQIPLHFDMKPLSDPHLSPVQYYRVLNDLTSHLVNYGIKNALIGSWKAEKGLAEDPFKIDEDCRGGILLVLAELNGTEQFVIDVLKQASTIGSIEEYTYLLPFLGAHWRSDPFEMVKFIFTSGDLETNFGTLQALLRRVEETAIYGGDSPLSEAKSAIISAAGRINVVKDARKLAGLMARFVELKDPDSWEHPWEYSEDELQGIRESLLEVLARDESQGFLETVPLVLLLCNIFPRVFILDLCHQAGLPPYMIRILGLKEKERFKIVKEELSDNEIRVLARDVNPVLRESVASRLGHVPNDVTLRLAKDEDLSVRIQTWYMPHICSNETWSFLQLSERIQLLLSDKGAVDHFRAIHGDRLDSSLWYKWKEIRERYSAGFF